MSAQIEKIMDGGMNTLVNLVGYAQNFPRGATPLTANRAINVAHKIL